jgi:predicted unusual protein kinase regulating ubiquinone biosynthesis (AarF/ABC1/UbiB family)
VVPRVARPGVRTFGSQSNTLAKSRKILKLVIVTPIKYFVYLGGAYGIFCIGYSVLLPREWNLSDHNVLLTGIKRFVRTVFNAALILAIYKYSFWGVVNPNRTDEGQFGPPNGENVDEELTAEQKEYKEIQHKFWEFAANRIAQVMLTNGGSYIKIGQGMATYSAMLPPEFATALKPLLSSIFERQSGEVDHMFIQDLGDKPENIFAHFQRDPIAGASIAQVFLGKTHSGQKVAIKVQYFDIAQRFKMDKGTCLFLLRVLD